MVIGTRSKQIEMVGKLKRRLWDVISSGLPVDYDLEVLRKVISLNLLMILASLSLLALGSIAIIQNDYILGLVDFAVFLFVLFLFSYLRRGNKVKPAAMIGTIVTGVFFVFLVAYGGVKNTAYVWAFTYPLISLILLGHRRGTVFSLLLLIMAVIVFSLGDKLPFLASYGIDLSIRFVGAYLTVYMFTFVMEKVRGIIQSRLTTSNLDLAQTVGDLERANKEKEVLIQELQSKIDEIKRLRGIIPICANCKKIRDDSGYWNQVEDYIRNHSEAQFTHGICPECIKKLYPEIKMDTE